MSTGATHSGGTLWGGRFADGPSDALFALSRSVQFDWRLAPYDLRSSLAHLAVLESSGLLPADTVSKLRGALKELQSEVSSGKFAPIESDEDVHSALERGLTEKIGAVGGAIRAGRSRNDQVATDLRLYAIDHMLAVAGQLNSLCEVIIAKATEYSDAPAPGFTHLQHAQPVIFGHEIAKHAHAFQRDLSRISDWLDRTSVSPLGSGALAGFFSGLLGVGGGLIIVPALRKFTDLPIKSIVATSLGVLTIISTGGVLFSNFYGAMNWSLAWPFSVGSILGLLIGRQLVKSISGPRVQQAFAIFAILIAMTMLIKLSL